MKIKSNLRCSKSVSAYLRWLQLSQASPALPGMAGYGLHEKALFEALILAWSEGQPLTVRHATNMEHLGSVTTLHGRLLSLRKMDLIATVHQDGDIRTKYLVPTPRGLKHVGAMARLFAKASQ